MPVTTIRDLGRDQTDQLSGITRLGSPWRRRLLPANFAGKAFHTEAGSRESGRRIVTHEFPKKDLPYSEDMGRRAVEFSVRGYIIQFVKDTAVELYQRDYTIARNHLQERLDQGGPGTLQLPLMPPLTVVCTRYRLTEEERSGGYCVFDMTFVELGAPPFQTVISSYEQLVAQSQNLDAQVQAALQFGSVQLKTIANATSGQIAGGRPFPSG